MNPQLKTSPEVSESFDAQKLWVLKGTCHKIAWVAMWLVMMTWIAWCKSQDANAQTAPPLVEAEMPVIKTAQLSQTVQPKVINASVSVPEDPVELDIPTLNAEIEAIEVKIAELEREDPDSLSDKKFDLLLGYQDKRDNLREQVDALRNVELAAEKAETAAEKAETAAEQQRTKDLQEALEQARKLSWEK